MQRARYTRIYAGADGESHFAEVEVPLIPTDFAPPAAPLNIAALSDVTRCNFVGAFPDWGGEVPHPSPRRRFFCTMAGEYEVTASDGDKRRFPPGSLLLLEDTTGKGHSTRVTGRDDVLIFAVALA